jgi:hypothetical protein
MKALTRQEKYLFSLTGSKAKTPAAQRAAIEREGLSGMTSHGIEMVRRESWKRARDLNKGVPVFVLALQRSGYFSWKMKLPSGVKPGVLCECNAVRRAAYDAVDWGRLRKHAHGINSAYGAAVREETNGKSGWDKVVWRYADYGCVLSPDGKKVAYSVQRDRIGPIWKVSPCFRGRFFLDGCPVRLWMPEPPRYQLRLRDCLRLLQNAGFTAYLTRQTKGQIAAGSGDRGREGELVLIVDLGKLGFYHAEARPNVVAIVREAARRREENREQSELEVIVARGEAAGVYVCAADSYRAGNCRPGTASFAGRHNLEMTRHYTAGELLQLANGDARFVRAAVISALRRERREYERGYALLEEHRA